MKTSDKLFNLEHRRIIREAELALILEQLPAKQDVVELGAGAGWQARQLSNAGHNVKAYDIQLSNYNNVQEWPVEVFDGVNIPLESTSTDVVFSSNVLEHVKDLPGLQKEIERVLRPGGLSIHVMPSSTWRLWTFVTFYPKKIIALFVKLTGRTSGSNNKSALSKTQPDYKTISGSKIFPRRHGERGNAITELYYFSRMAWKDFFNSTNMKLLKVQPNNLLYSGNRLFGSLLPLGTRKLLSPLLGSSCYIYVLQKPESGQVAEKISTDNNTYEKQQFEQQSSR